MNASTGVQTHYTVFTTKKPADTSLSELGLSLTGKTVITVAYTTQSFLEKFI
jgi:hypothetical protein